MYKIFVLITGEILKSIKISATSAVEKNATECQYLEMFYHIIMIRNWLVRALNADWLTAVVYQTVNHRFDFSGFYFSNYVGKQFIIAIRHLWCL